MNKNKSKTQAFRLSGDAASLLEQMAEKYGTTKTALLETAIMAYACSPSGFHESAKETLVQAIVDTSPLMAQIMGGSRRVN